MSDMLRIQLTGKSADTWDRIFEKLVGVIETAVDGVMPTLNEESRDNIQEFVQDVAEVSKGYIKARMEKPSLENELKIAQITKAFEESKLIRAQADNVAIDTKNKVLSHERGQLELLNQRIEMALKWLGFLSAHVHRDKDGNAYLVLTNQHMSDLTTDLKELQNPTDTEKE